ncbi:MAG TPA: 1,6-anhydro-N-acetylmuramyl-L-alanine amidase AmpD [Burkholderiaceae bacterium]|nr:1,6-anhydro-N-acetylmuramyl-L-alanine amidase AmpD [Burkholderiaceae bacterium]
MTGAAPDPWAPGSGLLRAARQMPSPNCDDRPPAVTVDALIVHYISLPPGRFGGDAVERLFTNRLDPAADPSFAAIAGLRVSAHLFVRRRGELIQFVDCDRRAWHAGVSRLRGRERCNDFSIGVELEGDGEHRFTDPQYRRLAAIVHRLCTRYPLRWAAGHSDVAPGRKEDPGPFFDWPRFLASIAATGIVRP